MRAESDRNMLPQKIKSELPSTSALNKLVEGNRRFVSGVRSIDSLHSARRLAELAREGQRPFAIVLTCSDSRVPTEIVFDQGFGDLFIVRVAGNVVAPSLLASIEFAALSFHTPLILVMGHTECGAIKASFQPIEDIESPNLRDLVQRIQPAAQAARADAGLGAGADQRKLVDYATWANVRRSQSLIEQESSVLAQLVREGKLQIVGSVFDLHTGIVHFASGESECAGGSV